MANSPGTFEQEYYAANYPNYDRQNPPRKLQHYREAVRQNLPSAESVRVFDMGCAFGKFLAALDPQWHAYGADVSEYAIGAARARVPRARLEVIRDSSIPFQEQFHAITAWDVIEHIPDLDRVAADVSAHLVDGGAFIFVVPVYDGPLGPVVRALDADPTHVHKTPRQFWLDWAGRHFELRAWWGIFRYLLPGGLYVHWPTQMLRAIAPAIAVVTRWRAVQAPSSSVAPERNR